jgi:predicted house-cleaning noncanonical NTP pyrophosphatase (MazG superfamily)
MDTKKYNKVIRDKIPEIIADSGKKYTLKQLDDVLFLAELEKKLNEELIEYTESKDVEELADLLEVIYRISELRGVNSEELDEIRKDKAEKRGKFASNLFLIDAEK